MPYEGLHAYLMAATIVGISSIDTRPRRVEGKSMDPSTLDEHIIIGMELAELGNSEYWNMSELERSIEHLNIYLEKHKFAHVITQAHQLNKEVDSVRRAFKDKLVRQIQLINADEASRICNAKSSIVTSLMSHAQEIQVIALNNSVISDRLRNLHEQLILSDSQIALRDEVVRCMTCGAYRSAMVMAWNLALDYIRSWILSDSGRLNAFNGILTTKQRKKSQNYDAIKRHEDFFAVKESDILQWALEANLINDKLKRQLVEWLDRRNDYAHPTPKTPEPEQAMGKIIDLLDVIEGSPFAHQPSC